MNKNIYIFFLIACFYCVTIFAMQKQDENDMRKNITNNNCAVEEEIIQKTVEFVKNKMLNESTGHDWWHVYRVWKNSILIGQNEHVNIFVVQLAALLHDIADWKFHDGDITIGPNMAAAFLEGLNVDKEVIEHVYQIIKYISFKGAQIKQEVLTKEGCVVQDADRLDAIGAIGIARAFAYGGFKKREIYNPEVPVVLHNSFEQYKSNTSPTINHFYEKLLLLKGLMNTQTAKEIAIERHEFMEEFLKFFLQEHNFDLIEKE